MPEPPETVKIHRAALACTIYANNVTIDKPMLWPAQSKAAFEAADKFIEYFKSNELPNDHHFTEDLKETVRTMLQSPNQKIPAIKEVRLRTGWGLKESKEFVEEIEKEEHPRTPGTGTITYETAKG